MRLSLAKIILRVALAGCALLGCLQQLRSQNIELEIRDRDSRAGTSARLRFTKGEKQAGLPRNLLKVGKWTLAESNIPIAPKPGEYEFLAQRGHEFNEIRGGFSIEKGARDVVSVELLDQPICDKRAGTVVIISQACERNSSNVGNKQMRLIWSYPVLKNQLINRIRLLNQTPDLNAKPNPIPLWNQPVS